MKTCSHKNTLFINNNKNQNKKVGILHRTYHPFFSFFCVNPSHRHFIKHVTLNYKWWDYIQHTTLLVVIYSKRDMIEVEIPLNTPKYLTLYIYIYIYIILNISNIKIFNIGHKKKSKLHY